MHYCKKLKMLLLQNLRLHFYVLKLYLNKEDKKNNYIRIERLFFSYRSSLSFLLAFLSLAYNLVISRLTASSRFCAILRRKRIFYDLYLIQKKMFTYVLK
jgi:hypothetical protein